MFDLRILRDWGLSMVLILSFLSLTTLAQTQKDNQPEGILRIRSELITMDVLVTDKRTGARIEGLAKESFEVWDDGQQVEITHFSNASAMTKELAIFLVFDIRDMTVGKGLRKIVSALEASILRLPYQTKLAVLAFNDDGRWKCNGKENVRWVEMQSLTANSDLLKAAFAQLLVLQKDGAVAIKEPQPEQSSKKNLINGNDLALALQAITRQASTLPSNVQPVIIAISDDINGGTTKMVLDTAKQLLSSRITVSGLRDVKGALANFLAGASDMAAGDVMSDEQNRNINFYAAKTGGEIVNVKNDDYTNALELVIGNTVGRYSLGFVPDEKKLDGKLHKLTVKVKIPPAMGKEKQLIIRTRQGYIAVK